MPLAVLLCRKSINLHRHNEGIGICFHTDKAAVRRPTQAFNKVFEIVKLLNFPQLVLIIKMRDKPILRILENITRYRAYFLGCVYHPQTKLRTLLRNAVVNLTQILIIFFRKEIMRLFKIQLDVVGRLIGNEALHAIGEDTSANSLRISALELGIS